MALAVFGVLGLANPGFWFLGVGYLGLLSSSSRFQKLRASDSSSVPRATMPS